MYYYSITSGPRLMRIHLVRNSTSAKFEKNPKINGNLFNLEFYLLFT